MIPICETRSRPLVKTRVEPDAAAPADCRKPFQEAGRMPELGKRASNLATEAASALPLLLHQGLS
jgi:hypothetical protein